MATSTSTPAATNETTSPPGGVEVQQDARDKKRLYVSWAVTDQSLIAVARAARPEAKVVEARALSGPARAFGFVTFATEEEAAAALAAMNGKTITTEPIQVDFAKISSGEKKTRLTRRNQNSARPKKKREPKAASGGNAPAGKKEPKPKKETPAKQAAPQTQGENGAPAKRGPKKEKKEKAKKEDAPAASTTPASTSTPAATTTPSSPAPAKTTPATPAKSPATTSTPAATSTTPAPKAEKAKGSKGKKEAPKA